MPKIEMNTEAVASASSNVKQTFQQIQQELSTLNSRITSLESEYRGPDGIALQGLFARYHQQAQALNETLSQIGVAMGMAADNVEATVATNTRMFQQ